MSARQDLSVSWSEVSGDVPRCPRCYADLAAGPRSASVEVANDEEDEGPSTLTVAWCPKCGTVIGPFQ